MPDEQMEKAAVEEGLATWLLENEKLDRMRLERVTRVRQETGEKFHTIVTRLGMVAELEAT